MRKVKELLINSFGSFRTFFRQPTSKVSQRSVAAPSSLFLCLTKKSLENSLNSLNQYFLKICIFLAIFFISAPIAVEAVETIGIAGCFSRENVTNMPKERGKLYSIVNICLMDGIESIPGVMPVDLSEDAKQARLDEAYLGIAFKNLESGNVSEIVKEFDTKPDYIVYAYLTGLTVTHRESINGANMAVRADISARILNTDMGRVVFVATGTGDADSHQSSGGDDIYIGKDKVPMDTLHNAIDKACEKIQRKMRENI